MAVQVSFESLKSNHFSHENFIGRLRGRIAAFLAGPPPQSTCATQISYALNGAGAMIEAYEYESPEVAGKKVRALQDDARRNYIYSVIDLKVYLNNRYGQAENYKGSKDEMIAKIRGRQGILAFGHSAGFAEAATHRLQMKRAGGVVRLAHGDIRRPESHLPRAEPAEPAPL